jgi:hypothetical protein
MQGTDPFMTPLGATEEKERMGNLWAERSEGTALFLMIRTQKDFSRIVEAVWQGEEKGAI